MCPEKSCHRHYYSWEKNNTNNSKVTINNVYQACATPGHVPSTLLAFSH